MKKIALGMLGVVFLLALSACNDQTEANVTNLTKGMNDYLAKRGEFCLAKTDWPIEVTQRDMDTHARNALQMPVLEKNGLVQSSIATIDVRDEATDTMKNIRVMRYELTDQGKKYYLPQGPRKDAAGNAKDVPGDFCAAKLSLDKIVAWDPPKPENGVQKTVVTYTYRIDAAPWTQNSDIQKAFPMIAYIVHGEKKVQLKESFRLTRNGWESVDL